MMTQNTHGSALTIGFMLALAGAGCDGGKPVGPGGDGSQLPVSRTNAAPTTGLSDAKLTDLLIGVWRFTTPDGIVSSTFRFEGNGKFTYYVTSTNPLANGAAAAGGQLYGTWAIRGSALGIEYGGGDNPLISAAIRGNWARAPLVFAGPDEVNLTGVEGDQSTRTYFRMQ